MSSADRAFLAACVELAEQGRMTCAPNPTVGCLIVRDGKVLGRGYHARTGEGHAEVNAIADAGGEVGGATVYVSLEPCSFESRTGACTQALIEHNVARVVVACLDPHPRVSGEGMQILERAGVAVELISLESAARCIEGYVSRVTRGQPLVRLKTAGSLDGAMALADGTSQWITGPAARDDVQYWRARSDAVVTGVETVIADNPALTVRSEAYAHAHAPLRVVLDSRLRIPVDAQLLNDGKATLIVHHENAQVPDTLQIKPNVECVALPQGPHDLHAVLQQLGERGCNEVLIEAGPRVVGSFINEQCWDYCVAYVAPKWLGSSARSLADLTVARLSDAPQGQMIDTCMIGDDIRMTLKRR